MPTIRAATRLSGDSMSRPIASGRSVGEKLTASLRASMWNTSGSQTTKPTVISNSIHGPLSQNGGTAGRGAGP